VIRVAGRQDAAEVARLLAAFRDHGGWGAADDAVIRRSVDTLLDDPQTVYLLAGDPPVGVCQLRFRLAVWTGVEDCWLEDLYVDERGQGHGTALVEAALEVARERGCRRVELDVQDDNPRARALYERLGFAEKLGGTAYLQRRL
jgi:ribosomal protein S18 acetylase RimI-like enzyme